MAGQKKMGNRFNLQITHLTVVEILIKYMFFQVTQPKSQSNQ